MYTPVGDDEGKRLRATAGYADEGGLGKSAEGISEELVTSGDPVLNRYDANSDGAIDKSEVIAAINDYLFAGVIARFEVIAVINRHLFG